MASRRVLTLGVLAAGLFRILLGYELITFSANLERFSVRGPQAETIRGRLYYAHPYRIHLEIHQPIEQYVIFNDNRLLLYYPSDKRACVISNQPGLFAFINAFLSGLKDDYGLVGLGFTLTLHTVDVETLRTYWSPPASMKKIIGQTVLAFAGDRLQCAEVRGADDQVLTRTHYRAYRSVGPRQIPTEMSTSSFSDADTSIERVIFSDCRLNEPWPQAIRAFRIPDDIAIEAVK